MTCATWGATNEAGRKFCGECGARLAVTCPSCGTANAAITALRDLGLPFDEAWAAMAAVGCLGTADPEILGCATRAAEFLDQVGAAPVAAQLAALMRSETPAAPLCRPSGAGSPGVTELAGEAPGSG